MVQITKLYVTLYCSMCKEKFIERFIMQIKCHKCWHFKGLCVHLPYNCLKIEALGCQDFFFFSLHLED